LEDVASRIEANVKILTFFSINVDCCSCETLLGRRKSGVSDSERWPEETG
jgi:hypothetical protein